MSTNMVEEFDPLIAMEDLSDSSNEQMPRTIELGICLSDHPKQAVFLLSLDMSLSDFRTYLEDKKLFLPEKWVFVTRNGNLIAEDQEESIMLNSITKQLQDTNSIDVVLAPAISHQTNRRNTRGDALSSFATIVGAVRDIYVSSIQPNLHELIKPLAVVAAVIAFLSFLLAFVLALNFNSLASWWPKSQLMKLLCHDKPQETYNYSMDLAKLQVEVSKLQYRVKGLEKQVRYVRQVETGLQECGINPVSITFQRSKFIMAPRLMLAINSLQQSGEEVDDDSGNLYAFSLVPKASNITSRGFSLTCTTSSYETDVKLKVSWIAIGH